MVEFYTHCDVCGNEEELKKIDTEGEIIRVCNTCNNKITNDVDTSLFDYKNEQK